MYLYVSRSVGVGQDNPCTLGVCIGCDLVITCELLTLKCCSLVISAGTVQKQLVPAFVAVSRHAGPSEYGLTRHLQDRNARLSACLDSRSHNVTIIVCRWRTDSGQYHSRAPYQDNKHFMQPVNLAAYCARASSVSAHAFCSI